jgi:hypothetical protein
MMVTRDSSLVPGIVIMSEGAPNRRFDVVPEIGLWSRLASEVAAWTRSSGGTLSVCLSFPFSWGPMSVPGVGAIVSLTFAAAIDDPARFKSSKQVGAYFGLTPTKYQSGETDIDGLISKISDVKPGMRAPHFQTPAQWDRLQRAFAGEDNSFAKAPESVR